MVELRIKVIEEGVKLHSHHFVLRDFHVDGIGKQAEVAATRVRRREVRIRGEEKCKAVTSVASRGISPLMTKEK
jgi:hypothetical protein